MSSNIDLKEKNKKFFANNHLTIFYYSLVVIHAFFYGSFLFLSYQYFLVTMFEFSFLLILIVGAFYTFIKKNPYYRYFFYGMFFSSFTILLVLSDIVIIIIPELIYLIITSPLMHVNWDAEERSQKWNLVFGLRVKNDRIPTELLIEREKLQKKYSMKKIGIISFICTLGFLITSAIILNFWTSLIQFDEGAISHSSVLSWIALPELVILIIIVIKVRNKNRSEIKLTRPF